MTRIPKLKISWRRGKQYTSPVTQGRSHNYTKLLEKNIIFNRGVSDVGFSIFTDTDADFAFQYPRISDADADIIYFIILGL